MNTLNHLLQEADPLRRERRPSLEATRERIRSAPPPHAAAARRPRVRRRLLVPASICVVLALSLSWASYHDRLPAMTPVAAQVRFEVRLAEGRPVPGLRVAQVGTSGALIYLHTETVVGNDDVAHAWVVDDGSARFGIGVQLEPGGAARMRQATAEHVGRPVAILIDGTVVMAPIVRAPIGDAAVITGEFTREAAARIAAGIDRR